MNWSVSKVPTLRLLGSGLAQSSGSGLRKQELLSISTRLNPHLHLRQSFGYTFLTLIAGTLSGFQIGAQSADSVGGTTTPGTAAGGPPPTLVRLISDYVSPSQLGDGGASASFYQVSLQSQIPFPIAGGLTGTLGLGVENRGYDFDQFDTFMPGLASPLDQALAARIAPGLAYRLNDTWRLFAGASWLYTGAVGTSVQEASMWGGSVGALYQVSTLLTLALGLTATERIGYPALVVPLLGFNWKVSPRWTLVGGDVANTIGGPTLGLQASYRLDDQWTLFGVGAYVATFTRLDDDSSITSGAMRYRSAAVLAGVEYTVTPGWMVRLAAGARLAQQYSFLDASSNTLAEDTTGTSATVGLTVRASF